MFTEQIKELESKLEVLQTQIKTTNEYIKIQREDLAQAKRMIKSMENKEIFKYVQESLYDTKVAIETIIETQLEVTKEMQSDARGLASAIVTLQKISK